MTVVARKIIATPERSATDTWKVILDLLAPDLNSMSREELLAISGIACSLIADETMKAAPIVVFGSGPRVRIYCLYDEDAITGDNANENALAFNATDDGWHMSLPCGKGDLAWVTAALKKLSNRVTARDMEIDVETENAQATTVIKTMHIDKEAFLRP
jgi:hypothetical protein